VSGACQRWRDHQHSWRHVAEGGFTAAAFDVVALPQADDAEPFVLAHHYALSYPSARRAYALVTTDDRLASGQVLDGRHLVGAAVLSVPMQKRVLTSVFPTLEPYYQTLELGRLVLTDPVPANAETWFLRRVFRLARDSGIRGVVSFSDPLPRRRTVVDVDGDGRLVEHEQVVMPGHVGIVYQALNAHACGRSTPRTLKYLPRHGQVLSDRTLQKLRAGERGADGAERRLVALGASPRRAGVSVRAWLPGALQELHVTPLRHPGCYRYAWQLGGRVERRAHPIALPRTPYPKPGDGRAGEQMQLPIAC
jgi:hypothetical protein